MESLLTLGDAQHLMEDVAKSYLFREKDELTRDDAIVMLRNSLMLFRNPKVRDLRPSMVLDYIVNRTGVLRELPPYGRVDFWHKSFQEYLAACALVAQGDDQTLLSHCAQALWREVLVWASSFMPMERASTLIVTLLDEANSRGQSLGQIDPKHFWTLVRSFPYVPMGCVPFLIVGLLAGAWNRAQMDKDYISALALSCAHYTLQLSEEAQEEVQRCANRLIPPRTSAQLDAIVKLGQAAVPFLEQVLNDASVEQHHKDTLVALFRIGGEAANTVLSLSSDDFKLNGLNCWLRVGLILAPKTTHAGFSEWSPRLRAVDVGCPFRAFANCEALSISPHFTGR